MIVMVTAQHAATRSDRMAHWVDGVTYLEGTPHDVERRQNALADYQARARAHATGPAGLDGGVDPGPLTFHEVGAIPDAWTALATGDDRAANLAAYARVRALGLAPAIPTGKPAGSR